MNKRAKQGIIAAVIGFVLIVIILTVAMIQRLTPSKERMELSEYYVIEENEAMIIMQDNIYEENGIYEDGMVYVSYNTVVDYFNKRIYWDGNENLLIFTTPTEVIKAEANSKDYMVNKNKETMSAAIAKTKGEAVYVSLEFVKKYSNMDYSFYPSPNRVVIEYDYKEQLISTVKKATQLRFDDSIKSEVLVDLELDSKLLYVDTSEVFEKGFAKVMTVDGIMGYVQTKYLQASQYETLTSDYKEPVYSNIKKDGKINLVWHQVTNQSANGGLQELIADTKGVNVVSPTWFSVNSNEGTITSLASESYVERAHSLGLEVWGLVDDFNPEVSMYELLSYTSRRERLVNEIIAEAIKFNLDGINIDFELISLDAGKHFIQFIRELSIKARNNNIVLSIDNYIPMNYSAYYDIEEQATVADYVIIMAYDEHHSTSDVSGSVASIGFVKKAINNSLELADKDKLIIGLPFYTRAWTEVKDGDSIKVSSAAYGMNAGINLLKDNGVEAVWDEESGQYYGEFEKDGALVRMWLEEDESIELKLKAIDEAKVKGIAGWKLGLEKESIWNVIIKYIN